MKKVLSQVVVAVVCAFLGFLLTYQFKQLSVANSGDIDYDSADILSEIEILKKEKEDLQKNNEILSKALIKGFKPLYSDNTLDNNLKKLENNLFEILYANEYFPYLRFKDIGAIVYFAKIIEWEFPNFSVENCFEELCKLNEDINAKGYVESIEHRYIIVSRKK